MQNYITDKLKKSISTRSIDDMMCLLDFENVNKSNENETKCISALLRVLPVRTGNMHFNIKATIVQRLVVYVYMFLFL